MERKVKFEIGEHYHIFSRGVEKRKIFLKSGDYERFLALVYILNQKENFRVSSFLDGKQNDIEDIYKQDRSEKLVSIISYSLMPNHFHFFIQETTEGGISKFMGKLLTAYSMYFNIKYDRSGPLFVRPFRSVHVGKDNQFNFLFQYINCNPLELFDKSWEKDGISNKVKAKEFMLKYRYSSFQDLLGIERIESKIIDKVNLPDSARGALAELF